MARMTINVGARLVLRGARRLCTLTVLAVLAAACRDVAPTQPLSVSASDVNTLETSTSLSATSWTASGPGTVSLISDGSTTNPQMNYFLSPSFSGTWRLGTTASTSGTVDLGGYSYIGFHSWYQAVAFIRVFILRNGSYTYPLADLQSASAPDVFSWSGAVPSFDVEAGDYYGLEFGGSHFDGTLVLRGTVTVTLPTPCVAGKYFLGGTGCVDAPAGSYSPGGTATSATLCPAGTFSSNAGSSSCAAAPAGSYATGPGATSATLCAAGNYSANEGQAACDAAPAGSFVAGAGATSATSCSAGYYQPNTGSTSCIAADIGFYVPGAGATSQTACPSGTTTTSTGSTSCAPVYVSPVEVYDALISLASTTPGVTSGEVNKLIAARRHIGTNPSSTCKAITAFMSYVTKQSGRKISPANANALLQQAQASKTALGCT